MAWDPGSIRVQTTALTAAASVISTAGASARLAEGRARTADAATGAFGGEPAGEAFGGACMRAISALGSIGDTLDGLATSTAAAAEGYVVTDQGAMVSKFGQLGGVAEP